MPEPEKLTDIVACIICGLQHSGTTMLGELLRCDPGLEGRFEAGLMAFDTFDEHRQTPFHRFLRDFWKLTPEQIEEVYAAGSIRQSYELLRKHAGFEHLRIFDKAPRCALNLREILARTDLPAIFAVRDPRAVLHSARKRVEWPLKNFADHYRRYLEGLERARAGFPDRVLVVGYENLCRNPAAEGERIYRFLDLDWQPEYAELRDTDPATSAKVQGSVSTDFINQYHGQVSAEDQQLLLEMLAPFGEFFDTGDPI